MIDENGKSELERSHLMEELWEEGVKLPPEPTGQCSRQGFPICTFVHREDPVSNSYSNSRLDHDPKFEKHGMDRYA